MTKLTIDPAFAAKLTAPAELTDDAGKTIGYLITPGEYFDVRAKLERRRQIYELANSLVTDEELDAANAEGGEYTLEEVMEHLRSLEGTGEAKSA
jgi:hypothetical protein